MLFKYLSKTDPWYTISTTLESEQRRASNKKELDDMYLTRDFGVENVG